MNNKELISEKILQMIEPYRGSKKILPNTSLLHDLGIDGCDAERLMNEYFEYFNIDNTNFDFDIYFGFESTSIFLLVKELFESLFTNKNKTKRLTIQMLIENAEKGKWVD